MERSLLVIVIDRAAANARVIRTAPEAIALVAIVAVGLSSFGFEQFHRGRVATLNDKISSQERLLIDYRTKLEGTDQAAAHFRPAFRLQETTGAVS